MDNEVRELLGGLLPDAEPPMPQLNLAAGRTARRRSLAARSLGALAVIALGAATVVFVTNGSARSPAQPGYAPPANETSTQVFARLDRAWRDIIPGGAALVHERDDNGQSPSDFGITMFAGDYHLSAPAETTQVGYAVIHTEDRGGAPVVDPEEACRAEVDCTVHRQPDGTIATVSRETSPSNHLVGRIAQHYRAGRFMVEATVYVPGDNARTAHFPLTDRQLLAAATDPRLIFAAGQSVPTTLPPPAHTQPTQNPPVPQASIPTLAAQPHCAGRVLPASIGTAAASALHAKLAELADPTAVVTHPGEARQLCFAIGAGRAVVVEGSTDHRATVLVEVSVTSYAHPAPITKGHACPPGSTGCQLTQLAGRTIAQYELHTTSSNNMELIAYYSPHVTISVGMAAYGNTSHTYGFTRDELIAMATDPALVEIARQLATAD